MSEYSNIVWSLIVFMSFIFYIGFRKDINKYLEEKYDIWKGGQNGNTNC